MSRAAESRFTRQPVFIDMGRSGAEGPASDPEEMLMRFHDIPVFVQNGTVVL